ncbi:hypothetical protein [Streptomyces sp. NBC_01750]|uniref:hypothetical protein n=1 Tax=Streptomyces sp. NBC_01750 TaxID=2975928 RepID=UPI002DD9A529|nr:hypothetical protein [Streptomyces sp. NBC_01750]WSD31833.1 hypothetical protein OG966_07830 [Streptomyces sp. NBC_01750]
MSRIFGRRIPGFVGASLLASALAFSAATPIAAAAPKASTVTASAESAMTQSQQQTLPTNSRSCDPFSNRNGYNNGYYGYSSDCFRDNRGYRDCFPFYGLVYDPFIGAYVQTNVRSCR